MSDLPPPIIQIGPVNQTLPIGSIAALPCQASSPQGEQPRIGWQKDGKLLQLTSQSRYHLKSAGILEIDSKYFYIHFIYLFLLSVDKVALCTVLFFLSTQQPSDLLTQHKNEFSVLLHSYRPAGKVSAFGYLRQCKSCSK